jgi:hypothetical protein
MLKDGEPADPAVFPTIVPTWRVGDEFLAGAELQRFRIVKITDEWDEDAEFARCGWSSRSIESTPRLA